MRTAYREHMDALAHHLLTMFDHVQDMFHLSNTALFHADSSAAESVFSKVEALEKLRSDAEADALELLARQAPVARDLRQVVSGIYIVEDIFRMAVLAVHIAEIAQRHNPGKILPDDVEPSFQKMSALCETIAHHARQVLTDYNVEEALTIHSEDDSVDGIHKDLFAIATSDSWRHPAIVTVDVTLLSRYYERFADHAVQVAARTIFLATGYKKEEYLNLQER